MYVRRCLVHSHFSLYRKHKNLMCESWQRLQTENSRRGKGIERSLELDQLNRLPVVQNATAELAPLENASAA